MTGQTLALRAARGATRVERGLSGLFSFDAPASVRAVQTARAVDLTDGADAEA